MTKNKYFLIAGSVIIAGAVIMYSKESNQSIPEAFTISERVKSHTTSDKVLSKKSTVSTHTTRTPANVGYLNKPSPLWQDRLENSLKEQAGDSLKDIQIKKERSLTWTRDEVPLSVESVIITLTNQQNEESSFRALVDSQTGKVLETWDRTVFDPADVRAGFHIKLKDHYSN